MPYENSLNINQYVFISITKNFKCLQKQYPMWDIYYVLSVDYSVTQ